MKQTEIELRETAIKMMEADLASKVAVFGGVKFTEQVDQEKDEGED